MLLLFISAPYVLVCDAYDLGIGGVLSQRNQEEEKAILKESRLFSMAENLLR